MGEGGIKNGQKNSDVFYGRPLMQVYFTHGWQSNLQQALKIVFEFQNVFKQYFD